MTTFSERNGYIKPSDAIIREKITPEIQNAICNCYDILSDRFDYYEGCDDFGEISIPYNSLQKNISLYFFNKRIGDYTYNNNHNIVIAYTEDQLNKWYEKLDLLEFVIKYLYGISQDYSGRLSLMENFIEDLNSEFKRLNFAYRIIDKKVVEVSSEEEIAAIEMTLKDSRDNIKFHIDEALRLYSTKPLGDYRNSIKESISAVEAFCREKTGEDTLGKALNKLESTHIIIPKLLKNAFDKLYAYTNQPENGIRHALMDDEGTYKPTEAEALFMLVSCCAFINYLNKKVS